MKMIKAEIKVDVRVTMPKGTGFNPWNTNRWFAWKDEVIRFHKQFDDMNQAWQFIQEYKLPDEFVNDKLEAFRVHAHVNFTQEVGKPHLPTADLEHFVEV